MTKAPPVTRFEEAFSAHANTVLPGLIPYFTAGFPRLDDTPELLLAAQDAGCVAAEIGIPFSDPLADGPTIQRSGARALANGMRPGLALGQIATARARGVSIPLAPMTYLNPVLAYGIDRFMRDAVEAGADGVIVPDLPFGEAHAVHGAAHAAGLALIPLVAPTTTPARLESICASAAGFVYCVSVTGVTGSRDTIAPAALDLLGAVRALTSLPRALGFGLSRHEHLVTLAGVAEAAVVGSALIDALSGDALDPAAAAARFLRGMLGA
jgi:tryptophan synthase alpha chain